MTTSLGRFLWVVYIVVILVLFGVLGCVSVRVQPLLPLPEAPDVTFYMVAPNVTAPQDSFCINAEDANKVRKFLDELTAYKAALKRLQSTP